MLGAGVVLLASALWWVGLVSFWPGHKPYIGGSTDGSVLNLVIGYNGLGRILGHQGSHRGHGGYGGGSGITRLFGAQLGGQISWLLPLCVLVLIAVALAALHQVRSGQLLEPARRAGWFLWGGWLVLVGLVLSCAQKGFHPYYTTELAPALAAVTAAGVVAMWRHYRQPGGYHWMLLPAAVTLSVGWAWVLVSRDTSWYGWLRYAVVAVGALAVVLLVAGRVFRTGALSTGMCRVAGVLSGLALLLAPGVWSSAAGFSSGGGAMAQAGPPGRAWGGAPARWPGAMAGDLTAQQRAIVAYAQANSGGRPITLAVEGGAMAAQAYLIHSDAAVVGMGGFSGADPAPTVATLAQWVQRGQLRFVLLSSPRRDGHGGFGMVSQAAVSAQRTQWVRQHCASVSAPELAGRAGVFYDCQAG